jgi:S1-C subfamily serine protease
MIFCFTLIFLWGLSTLLFGAQSQAGKIYKWVDERGVVHFSDRPPDLPDKLKLVVEERELSDGEDLQKPSNLDAAPVARSPIEFVANCTFTIKGVKRMGTGFLISSTGYAATCRHVIEESGELTAIMSDQQEHQLNVISTSTKHDLAIVQVMTSRRTPFLMIREADDLVPGERLFAVGASAGLQATVTDGVFTAFRKLAEEKATLIQFSAPVNPGNSGGPLVDEAGKVVGIVSQKFRAHGEIPISGVGFAVPSDDLKGEFGNYLE